MRRVFMLAAAGVIAAVVAVSWPVARALSQDAPVEPAHAVADSVIADEHVDHCVSCHTEEDYMPEGYHETDIHMQPGLSCAGCHGGDPTSDDEDVAMSEEAGFIGVPDREDIPEFCGRCHSDIEFMRQYQPRIATDQVSQYWTSRHGLLLAEGDKKVAECTSCHTSHAILPAHDARSTVYALNVPNTCKECHADPDYMADYNIRTNQYDDYASGVHGEALIENRDTGAPACNDCHGNHGALPPGTNSVSQVCGSCHVNNLEYFAASEMAEAWREEGLHGCEECHGNHKIMHTADNMVGITDESVCMDCHEEGDEGYAAARDIYTHLDGLVVAYDSAAALQTDVQRIGMDDEEIEFLLQESHQSLIQARTLVHTFDPQRVGEKTEEGVEKAREASAVAFAQMKDHRIRRRGFGMATAFITLLVIALFFKIRGIERDQAEKRRA